MENPYVDCIGHLTGRKIGRRPPADIDLERVIEKALETGTFLEINSQPDRLDLSDVHARAAREAGLKLVIDSDGHQISALDYVELGVGQARRAWLTKADVVNTHTWKQVERLRKRAMKAVIFDLWDTLVDWPVDEAEALNRGLARRLGLSEEEFGTAVAGSLHLLADPAARDALPGSRRARGARRSARQRSPRLRASGAPSTRRRPGDARQAPPARDSARADLDVLGRRAGGLARDGARRLLRRRDVLGDHRPEEAGRRDLSRARRQRSASTPEECFFVGDGANDELAGAARAGMTPVLMATGSEPHWPEVKEWSGLSVSSIPEVVELC